MGDITVPRETREFVPIPVEVDDVGSLDFETAVTRWPARPVNLDWTQASIDGDDAGVFLEALSRGTYQVWVRVGGSVVVCAGMVEVT